MTADGIGERSVWKGCATCNWPHGKYAHSEYCIPEPERRAMPEHTQRVIDLHMGVSMISRPWRNPVLTARLLADGVIR